MEYRTTDINLAAFLKAKHNLKIERLAPDNKDSSRAFFVFNIDDLSSITRYIAEYYNGNDLCSINIFMRELTDLRSWIKTYRSNI